MWSESTLDDVTLPGNNNRQSPRDTASHSRGMEISKSKCSFNGYICMIVTFQSPHFIICLVTYLMVESTELDGCSRVGKVCPNYFTGILSTQMQTLQKTLMVDYLATALQIHHIQKKLLS
jgi:hypothetical protein